MESSSEFLGLPMEVRVLIYEAIPHREFSPTHGFPLNSHATLHPKGRPARGFTLLAYTYKTLYDEIMPILYGEPFKINVKYSPSKKTTARSWACLPLLKKVALHVPLSDFATISPLHEILGKSSPLKEVSFKIYVQYSNRQFQLGDREAQMDARKKYGINKKGALEYAIAVVQILEHLNDKGSHGSAHVS